MIRHDVLLAIGLLTVTAAATGCQKPGAMERQREEQANEQLAQSKEQATRETQAAQTAAEKDITAARVDFDKTRDDYKHAKAADLKDLDKKIADLEAKARTAKDPDKPVLDAQLSTVRAKREAFVHDMSALTNATASSWDDDTARTSRDWEALKAAVDKAQ